MFGAVDESKDHSVLVVKKPCRFPALRHAALGPGIYKVQGDIRPKLGHIKSRRALLAGLYTIEYVEGAPVPEKVTARTQSRPTEAVRDTEETATTYEKRSTAPDEIVTPKSITPDIQLDQPADAPSDGATEEAESKRGQEPETGLETDEVVLLDDLFGDDLTFNDLPPTSDEAGKEGNDDTTGDDVPGEEQPQGTDQGNGDSLDGESGKDSDEAVDTDRTATAAGECAGGGNEVGEAQGSPASAGTSVGGSDEKPAKATDSATSVSGDKPKTKRRRRRS